MHILKYSCLPAGRRPQRKKSTNPKILWISEGFGVHGLKIHCVSIWSGPLCRESPQSVVLTQCPTSSLTLNSRTIWLPPSLELTFVPLICRTDIFFFILWLPVKISDNNLKSGLDPINKKLQILFRKSGQIFCFQEIPTDFQMVFL